jgi:hypothetical protein
LEEEVQAGEQGKGDAAQLSLFTLSYMAERSLQVAESLKK